MRKFKFLNMFLATCILLFVAWNITLTASAEEYVKTLQMPLQKDYESVKFNFSFLDGQSHSIKVITPSGSEVTKESDSDQVIVPVDEAVMGNYTIIITGTQKEVEVRASVECVNEPIKEVGNEISVSTVISGLKIYFSDGNVCVSWDESNIGSVNVKVVNPSTMQTLDDTSVDGTSYMLPLKNNVEEVAVSVVRASESKIDGAGVTYTKKVIREIAASFTEVPTYSLTNASDFSTSFTCSEPVTVLATDNGEEVFNEYFEAGDHDVKVPLTGVNNSVVVYLIDSNSNRISKSLSLTRDMVAPKISLDLKTPGAIESKVDTYTFKGHIDKNDTAHLFVNNTEEPFDAETGTFEITAKLNEGDNSFIFCAVDEAGNEASVEQTVTYSTAGGVSIGLFLVIAIFLIILVLVVLAALKVRNMKSANVEPEEKEEAFNEVKIVGKQIEKEVPQKKTEAKPGTSFKDIKIKKSDLDKKDTLGFCARCAAIIATMIVLRIIFAPMHVVSESMEPTLMTGSMNLFNNYAYAFKAPQRGDIIAFDPSFGAIDDTNTRFYTKRVIGLPGDEISFMDGYVFINGMKAEESYLPEDTVTYSQNTFVVPDNCVFVLGDNRAYSNDSRFWDNPYVPYEYIKGKYFATILPYNVGKYLLRK